MKLAMITHLVATTLFFVHIAFPQDPSRTGGGDEKCRTAKAGDKDDRFPDGRNHDFGRVAKGTYCKFAFRIVNTADSPLEITSVRSVPGAVHGQVSKPELKP